MYKMNIKQTPFRDGLTQEHAKNIYVTANQRQSRFLKQEILAQAQNPEQCLESVSSTQALSFNSWAHELWLRAQDLGVHGTDKYLLNAKEQSHLWQTTLAQYDSVPKLIDRNNLFKQCQTAYDIDCLYGLTRDSASRQILQNSSLEETHFYLQIKGHFLKACSENSALTLYQAIEYLSKNSDDVKAGLLEQENIFLYGFADIPFLYLNLVQSLDAVSVNILQTPECNKNVCVYHAESAVSELVHAAHWAKTTLDDIETEAPSDDPYTQPKQIAVIIPDLAMRRQQVERVFSQILEPEAYYSQPQKMIPKRFDISAGISISDSPVIADALILLNVCFLRIKKTDALQILQSPYWAKGYDYTRAKVREYIRCSAEINISIAQIIKNAEYFDTKLNSEMSETASNAVCLSTHAALTTWRKNQPFFRNKHPLGEWIDWYLDSLDAIGWPGERTLDSFEYQSINVFFDMLSEIKSSLLFRAQVTSSRGFLTILQQQCKQTVFQAQVKKPQLRILGMMEAAGLHFESSLILSLDASTLPSVPKPHPFFPMDIHHHYTTPSSSSEREYFFSNQLLEALISSSDDVSLSYASRNENGVILPSPLLKKLGIESLSLEEKYTINTDLKTYHKQTQDIQVFDTVPTGCAPPMHQGSKMPGAAHHLNLHWVNPLFAYFKFRLKIDAISPDTLGINALQRGIITHAVLAEIYTQFTHKRDIAHFIQKENFIHQVTQITKKKISSELAGKRLAQIIQGDEVRRIASACSDVLYTDANRSEEFEVHDLEKKISGKLFDAFFEIRVDRIDHINNRPFVYDYKTGKSNLTPLVKRPLNEYQLPLYACMIRGCVGVSYFFVRENSVSLTGLCAEDLDTSHFKTADMLPRSEMNGSWSTLINNWSDDLKERIREIMQGEVNYLPRNKTKSGMYEYYQAAVRDEERYSNQNKTTPT